MKASTFFAFIGGAALGAMTGLLLAPDSGSKTRKKLKNKLKEHGVDLSTDELNELINRLRHKKPKETVEGSME